jgi:hypothetical protein
MEIVQKYSIDLGGSGERAGRPARAALHMFGWLRLVEVSWRSLPCIVVSFSTLKGGDLMLRWLCWLCWVFFASLQGRWLLARAVTAKMNTIRAIQHIRYEHGQAPDIFIRSGGPKGWGIHGKILGLTGEISEVARRREDRFPLTPALSLGERGRWWASRGKIVAWG